MLGGGTRGFGLRKDTVMLINTAMRHVSRTLLAAVAAGLLIGGAAAADKPATDKPAAEKPAKALGAEKPAKTSAAEKSAKASAAEKPAKAPAAPVTEAPTGPVVVSVDATKAVGPNDPFWASLVFHPTEYLSTEWGEEHLRLLAAGGAARKYVRIYNQPEDAGALKPDGTVGYTWDHFDKRADMILKAGARPLVAFYSMPPQIAAKVETFRKRSFLDGKKIYIGPPKDYRLWQEMCADFTRHVIAKYGKAEVVKWRFTCWNEPDLSGFWHKADLPEHQKLYDYFAEGVKSVCPEVPIGGPSMSSSNIYKNPDLFRGFLEHIAKGTNHATGKTGSPIDYISIHTYGGHGGAGSSVSKYPSVEYLLDQDLRLAKIRDEFPTLRNVPMTVAEWGVTSSGGTGMSQQPIAEVRNQPYAAAFLAAMVARRIELQRTDDPRLGDMFICLSGYEKKRERDFEGKRTVQTLHGFDKPILNGYRILAKLGADLVACRAEPAGKDLLAVASRDGDKRIAVMIVNYKSDRIDSGGPDRTVELKVQSPWPKGAAAELRHWRIDQSHSNAYAVFCQMGRPKEPTADEIAKIKQRMGLEMMGDAEKVTVGETIDLKVMMPQNAVSVLEWVRGE